MRRRFGQGLRLGVARGGIALVKTSRWGRAPELIAAQDLAPGAIDSASGVQEALAALLDGAHAGWPLTIVLADDLARLWQVVPPRESSRLGDLEAAAAMRFQTLYGEPAAAWEISAGWDAVRPFLAAALPRALLAALEQGAAVRQMPLLEIVPQFVAVLNRCGGALKPDTWFGVVHDGVLTLGAGPEIAAVRAVAVPDGASADWLSEHLVREALRLNLPAPDRLQLWGEVPEPWIGFGCTRLGAAGQAGWPPAALLAASGSAA
ncbi:MAG: hypothetical protein JWP34_727 [Massilia sp.]|nr:hypothetical protein [Massilia sp.]